MMAAEPMRHGHGGPCARVEGKEEEEGMERINGSRPATGGSGIHARLHWDRLPQIVAVVSLLCGQRAASPQARVVPPSRAMERISVSTSGDEGDADSLCQDDALSADGRWTTFDSVASNLDPSVS